MAEQRRIKQESNGIRIKKRRRRKGNGILICLALIFVGFLGWQVHQADASGNEPYTPRAEVSSGSMQDEHEANAESVTQPSADPIEHTTPISRNTPEKQADHDPDDAWCLTLVNSTHPVPEGYEPPLQEVEEWYRFDARAVESLEQMLSDARKAGLSPKVCSAYRSINKQTELYDQQVRKQKQKGYGDEEAREEAKTVVAYPGTSEHQLGLAADIVSKHYQILDDKQADTPEAEWLIENCCKYGFILRYPPAKSEITGVIFEPWHYRYVGVKAATEIMENGLCLEEYLGQE